MVAALSLLRHIEERATQYTESHLLASFLQSREFVISSVALEYYMKTVISYLDPSAPSCHLPTAVSAVFSFTLPDRQLWVGWTILGIFVDGFQRLSVEWRRTFAEGFFTLSRHPLPMSHKHTEPSTAESELKNIPTWEYFHKEEQESKFTDSGFSGLDWMAMAWSLHLAQQSRSGPEVDEEFVLSALCKLLEASPYYQIIPIIPKIYEFT